MLNGALFGLNIGMAWVCLFGAIVLSREGHERKARQTLNMVFVFAAIGTFWGIRMMRDLQQ
jgi:uncharacterized membrane protein